VPFNDAATKRNHFRKGKSHHEKRHRRRTPCYLYERAAEGVHQKDAPFKFYPVRESKNKLKRGKAIFSSKGRKDLRRTHYKKTLSLFRRGRGKVLWRRRREDSKKMRRKDLEGGERPDLRKDRKEGSLLHHRKIRGAAP